MNRLLLLLLAACSSAPPPAGPVRHARGADPTVPFDFALYGDCRSGHATHQAICDRLAAGSAAFVVQTGDLVGNGDDSDDWADFRRITRPLRSRIPYHATKGNHDVGDDGYFETELGLGGSWSSVREGPVEFFLFDSTRLQDPAQLAWLDGALAASTAPHKVAVLHHPCYSLVPRRQRVAEHVRGVLHERFLKARLCAVFNGHDHHFYTTVRDGLRYVVTGGAGAPLYDADASLAVPGDLHRKMHHYLMVRVEERGMSARVHGVDGTAVEGLAFPLCVH